MEKWREIDRLAEEHGIARADVVRLGMVTATKEEVERAERFHKKEMDRITSRIQQKEASRMTFRINADDYRLLLVRIGKKSAPRWPIEKLKRSLKKFYGWAEAVEDELSDEDFEMASKIVDAIEEGNIEIIETGNKPEIENKPQRKRKRTILPDGSTPKERIFKMWSSSEDKSGKKAEEYHEAVGGAVKVSTIRVWISRWKKGSDLPASMRPKKKGS